VTRVAVSTIGRGVAVNRASGYLRILDLELGVVSFTVPVPESRWRAQDPNPRGGVRGARGMAVHDGRFVLAGYEDLLVMDASWAVVDRFVDPVLAGIHDIVADERGIWATCSRGDVFALIGWNGTLDDWWTFRADSALAEALDLRTVLPFDPSIDHRDPRGLLVRWSTVTLNGAGTSERGMLLSLGRVVDRGFRRRFLRRRLPPPPSFAVVELPRGRPARETAATLLLHRTDHAVDSPNHNPEEDGDLVVYNDSNRNVLVGWDRHEGREVHAVPIPGDPPFARGLLRLDDGLWLVGSQRPLAVHAVDLERGRVVASHQLDGGEFECVYAICPIPDDFDDPPQPPASDPYSFWGEYRGRSDGFTPIPQS
jgi:hypothetical protein